MAGWRDDGGASDRGVTRGGALRSESMRDAPQPKWYAQLQWSPAQRVDRELAPSRIPDDPGLYAFSADEELLSQRNCLYVGKADGLKSTLRSRLATYLRAFEQPSLPPHTHAGRFMLHRWLRQDRPLFVRWTIVAIARELEGSLIDRFDPRFNFAYPEPYFGDHDLIPDEFLPKSRRWMPRPGGMAE